MKNSVKYNIATTFIWVGFLGAISFMEAWLKFQAPNITIKLGLGIGKLVFKGLNYVELFCGFSILLTTIFSEKEIFTLFKNFFFLPFFIVLLQTFWLLPALDLRAVAIINDLKVVDSKLHILYIALEVVKMIGLFIFGIRSFMTSKKEGCIDVS